MKFKNCLRNIGDCIEGDILYIECQDPEKWKIFRKSGQHRGHKCKAKKGAKAIILRSYTNIKKPF